MKTVKQLSDEIGISKTAIFNAIKELGLNPQRNSKNSYVLNDDEVYEISVRFAKKLEKKGIKVERKVCDNFAESSEKFAESSEKFSESSAKFAETANFSQSANQVSNSSAESSALEILKSELDFKNQQILDLQEKLSKAYEQISNQSLQIADLANKAQYITATQNTLQLVDKQEESEEVKTEKSKSILERLFGK